MQFGLAVSVIVLGIGLAGLIGILYNPGLPQLIPDIPARLVYMLMILVNIPQILFDVVEIAQQGESDPKRVLNVNYLNQLINAFMAGFAIFSTKTESSLFFETVLIMLAMSSLPYWRRIRGYVVILTSIIPLWVAIVRYQIHVTWYDRYNIVIFYILCLVIMTLRRHWMEQSFWLMHRTELKNRALEKESRTDELTGLGNRTGLREDFPSFAGEQVIIIMMDLDNFKLYNDRYGHRFGDQVLQKTGQYIRKVFQPLGGKCYRYGGDEFLIVLQDVSIPLLDKELELLRTGYMSLFSDGQPHTLSIGYSYGRVENEFMLRVALSLADENLYASKAAGKNQISGKKVEASMQNQKNNQILSDLESVNYMDKLTGLLNWEGFHKRLERENLNEGNWAVICFDIDRFQEINRAVGYAGGNEVLVKAAGWLSRYFPESIISRHESDHFYVFTRCSGIERRIRRVQSEVAICREHCYIFFRAGIWSHAVMKTVPSLNAILDNAKYACDTLRNQSSHSMCFYSSQVEEERKKPAFVLNYFREALDKEQIEVYFQPIIGTMSKKCRGYEVLSRWVVPGKGILSPGEYIPVLEKSYDIYKLDLYVLRKACEF
ncbi:MAG: diguanylate cyclase, partial [Allisonella histaminiformans]|uniref:sensor domain-containing diguanylate cyclase n=1 Tax=Allisonella histaminiformans TaxID=209880 RepID=UPI002354C473